MNAHDTVSEAVASEALKLRDEDWTWREISAHVQRPLFHVQKAAETLLKRRRADAADLKRAADIATGRRKPTNGSAQNARKGAMKLHEIQDAIRLRTVGVTWHNIGDELGRDWKTVKRNVVKVAGEDPITEAGVKKLETQRSAKSAANLPVQKPGAQKGMKKHGKRLSDEALHAATELRKAGLAWTDIAERIGFTTDTTRGRVLKAYGSDPIMLSAATTTGQVRKRAAAVAPRKKKPKVPLGFSLDEAGRLRKAGRTWKAIAAELGVPNHRHNMGALVRAHFGGDPMEMAIMMGELDLSSIPREQRPRRSPKLPKVYKAKEAPEVAAVPEPPPVAAPPAPPARAASLAQGFVTLEAHGETLLKGRLTVKNAIIAMGLLRDLIEE